MITSKSSFFILLFNLKLEHIVNPWKISVDLDKELIIVSKRNWYLIGINETTIAFRYIRKITIKEYILGADINVHVYGAHISSKFLPKSEVKTIRNKLFEYNQNRKQSLFIIE